MTDLTPSTRLKLADFGEALREVGLSLSSVCTNPGPAFDAIRGAAGGDSMVLVVTVFAEHEKGGRYVAADGKVATETRRFFVHVDDGRIRLERSPLIEERLP